MTDYLKATGSTGTMMIRDDGLTVSFWLKAGSTTFNHSLPWQYIVAGVTSPTLNFDFVSGGAWQMLKSWNLTATQTVTFKIFDSGTTGLGGPTTFSQLISRTKPPDAPNTPIASENTTGTSVRIAFTDGPSNGGAAVDSRQIGWDQVIVSPANPHHTISSDGSDVVTGLTSGEIYFFWARNHNSAGWGPWSPTVGVTIARVPDTVAKPYLNDVDQTSAIVVWSAPGNGGAAITGYEVGWGTNPSGPTSTVPSTLLALKITGLTPGTLYYFWVRAINSVGHGPWSSSVSATTIAGLRVKVGAEWKLAIPYVKVGGVWKLAKPYVRTLGVWKGAL